MKRSQTLYQVVGPRAFRGHRHGTKFTARLDPSSELRAIRRGDLRVIARRNPTLQPGSYALPEGWTTEGGR